MSWTPELILAALRVRRRSLTQVALAHGYSSKALYPVLRERHWPKVESIIADELGVPAQELWPERYQLDGTPRPGLRSRLRGGA